ncbi:putative capsid protein [Kosakonia phage Kc263]|uniref:Capsid protein n=1 Tax=Kosakonia phage Kc263 TaxID=2863194 RepID=A0AAE7WFP7_9CAUD|nr:putative capsid protein [Kosakonia phage Kc263]QYN79947.1 putative capsid protein [Kosakonia phage Kc263]
MEPILLFPQWNNQNKDYFIDVNKVAPFTIIRNNHPFYKGEFLSSHIKPGVIPNLFVLCRPEGYTWTSTSSIKPDMRIKKLILEVLDDEGKPYYGEVGILDIDDPSTYITLAPTNYREWGIDGKLHHPNGFELFFPYDFLPPLPRWSTINDIPLKISFNTGYWALEFQHTTMDDLNATVVGIDLEIFMDDIER